MYFVVVECRNYHSTHVRCEKPVDLAFVIDISSSIWYKHFRREISFIHDIVNLLDVGDRPTQSRVAAVSFSNRLKPEFGLGQYSTKEGVLNAINNIAYEGGDATRTYLGLEYVHNTIFAPGNGERSNVANVVVVLTDGVTNPGSYDNFTRTEAKQKTQIHAQNIRDIVRAQIYAIGIGNEVDKNEIKGIANKPSEQFTLFVDTFTELDTDAVKKAVLTKVCDCKYYYLNRVSFSYIQTYSILRNKCNADVLRAIYTFQNLLIVLFPQHAFHFGKSAEYQIESFSLVYVSLT